jgi:DNA polymerase-3 subunit beta
MLDVVRRVGVVVQRTSPIQLRFHEGELTVFARTQDVGEAKESLPVQFAGEPLEIGFNAEFLREGIESIAADELRLKLISPLRPAVIEGDADDPTYLIMPIRLPG